MSRNRKFINDGAGPLQTLCHVCDGNVMVWYSGNYAYKRNAPKRFYCSEKCMRADGTGKRGRSK